MTVAALLKLAVVPLMVWLASFAGRRWGHGATGWISGLPLIAGPLMLFLALDHGAEFAAITSLALLQTVAAPTAHCLAFAWAAQRFGWAVSLAIGIATYLVVAFAVSTVTPTLGGALTLAMTATAIAVVAMPRAPRSTGPAPVPSIELWVRALFALAIAALVTLGATAFGPRLSGVFLTFPIAGVVLPSFTRALYGPAETARLLAGFAQGLIGFAVFFAVLTGALVTHGIAVAFVVATLAALATSELVRRGAS